VSVSIGWRRAVVVAVVALGAVASGVEGAGRQATPEGDETTAIVPPPQECRVEPRRVLFPGATATTAATPLPLASPTPLARPAGEPADAATTEAVTATVREAVACRNDGDFARAYALMSDAMLVRLFGGPETLDPLIAAALEAGPRRLPRPDRLALVAVADVRLLPDGRAAARVETRNADEAFVDELVFVRAGDRWLIDEAIPVAD